MTPDEAAQRMTKLVNDRAALHAKIADASRPIVAVLLDAGRVQSAKALQELFFEMDALDAEMTEFVKGNIAGLLSVMGRR